MRRPGLSSRATNSASRLAIVPLEVRWPRCAGSPNIAASWATDLLLHLARWPAAVERVVVRVDQHRGQVAGHRDRVRRLEHLAGVVRVEVRVVPGPQAIGELGEHPSQLLVADLQ
jgi:hypothetical protein